MSDFLQFIKEWMPSIGVIAGGGWLFFQWAYGERLRKKKEGAAIDGKLSTKVIGLENSKKLVTVEAIWNNRSPFPVYLDIHACKIEIFKIPQQIDSANCSLNLKSDLGAPICSNTFLLNMVEVDYYLEPETESTIINHFVLEKGIYGIRMILHTPEKGGLWWKECILDILHD